jgi:antitoxin component of MazEF toxin-antitoxin module
MEGKPILIYKRKIGRHGTSKVVVVPPEWLRMVGHPQYVYVEVYLDKLVIRPEVGQDDDNTD